MRRARSRAQKLIFAPAVRRPPRPDSYLGGGARREFTPCTRERRDRCRIVTGSATTLMAPAFGLSRCSLCESCCSDSSCASRQPIRSAALTAHTARARRPPRALGPSLARICPAGTISDGRRQARRRSCVAHALTCRHRLARDIGVRRSVRVGGVCGVRCRTDAFRRPRVRARPEGAAALDL